MRTIAVLTEPTSLAELVELARPEAGLMWVKFDQPVAQVLPVPEPAG